MKLTKEAKVGLLVSVALAIFFLGFYFLKGADLLSGENEYYIYYDQIQGLQRSASVQVKGLKVGRVTNIEYRNGEKIKVTIAVSKDVDVPVGTTAELASVDLLNPKVIRLNLGTGTALLEDESELKSVVDAGLIDNLSLELSPLIVEVRHVAASLDTVLIGLSGILNEETANNLSRTTKSLDVGMHNLSQLAEKLNNESENITDIIKNANSITGNIAENNKQITNIIQNAEKTTKQLAGAPIEQTVKDLQKTVKELQSVIAKMNGTEGSLGLLVNDKQLYENLNETLETLNVLMADLNENPSRYINVNIFGKKRKD